MKKTAIAALAAFQCVILAHGQTTESNDTPVITVTKNALADFQIGRSNEPSKTASWMC